MEKTRDLLMSTILKIERLISDYTLTNSNEEKDIFLTICERYIEILDNPEISLIYEMLCGSADHEKEEYILILMDLIDIEKQQYHELCEEVA